MLANTTARPLTAAEVALALNETEPSVIVEQEKLRPHTQNYGTVFTKSYPDFLIEMVVERDQVLSELEQRWPEKTAQARKIWQHINDSVHAIPAASPGTKCWVKVWVVTPQQTADYLYLPQPNERAVITSFDNSDGMLHRYIIPASDNPPSLDDQAIQSGLMVLSQSLSPMINTIKDGRAVGFGAGSIYTDETDRVRDKLLTGNDPEQKPNFMQTPPVAPLPTHQAPLSQSVDTEDNGALHAAEVAAIAAAALAAHHAQQEEHKRTEMQQNNQRALDKHAAQVARHDDAAAQRAEEKGEIYALAITEHFSPEAALGLAALAVGAMQAESEITSPDNALHHALNIFPLSPERPKHAAIAETDETAHGTAEAAETVEIAKAEEVIAENKEVRSEASGALAANEIGNSVENIAEPLAVLEQKEANGSIAEGTAVSGAEGPGAVAVSENVPEIAGENAPVSALSEAASEIAGQPSAGEAPENVEVSPETSTSETTTLEPSTVESSTSEGTSPEPSTIEAPTSETTPVGSSTEEPPASEGTAPEPSTVEASTANEPAEPAGAETAGEISSPNEPAERREAEPLSTGPSGSVEGTESITPHEPAPPVDHHATAEEMQDHLDKTKEQLGDVDERQKDQKENAERIDAISHTSPESHSLRESQGADTIRNDLHENGLHGAHNVGHRESELPREARDYHSMDRELHAAQRDESGNGPARHMGHEILHSAMEQRPHSIFASSAPLHHFSSPPTAVTPLAHAAHNPTLSRTAPLWSKIPPVRGIIPYLAAGLMGAVKRSPPKQTAPQNKPLTKEKMRARVWEMQKKKAQAVQQNAAAQKKDVDNTPAPPQPLTDDLTPSP